MMSWGRASKLRPIGLVIASCVLALLIGLALFRRDPLAARSSPPNQVVRFGVVTVASGATATPAIVAVPTATLFPSPLASPLAAPFANPVRSATVARASASAPPHSSPTAVPRVMIGRWQDHTVIITEAFVTRGPWRICWLQPNPAIAFQVMVGDAAQTTWEFYSAPTGMTSGHFDLPQSGAYRLMIHGETSYDVIVFERSSPGAAPPLCQ